VSGTLAIVKSRSTIIRFALALTVLGLAAWLWHGRVRSIDRVEAEARAARLLSAYAGQTGQPAAHFADRRILEFADEWQFIWAYRPCAAIGELRIAVRRTGAARYVVLPDCSPTHGFAVGARTA